jgi:NAD(P)-dependent dehydrogenase (short-subunit alcohol dehydrogenase family)
MPLGPDDVRLDGRVALVTGAAQGIGRATAVALARFGADVAVCDRNADELATAAAEIETSGRAVHSGVLDVRDQGQVGAWLATVAARFDHVDVLVNNAGGGFQAAFLDVNDKGQDALVRENFTSVTSFIRGVVPLMPDTGGSIVNVTSIEAHRAGPGFAVYSAMKAAQANLTKSLALELGPRMIRVNCVAPDVIPTPGIGADMGVRTPLPRAGHVDDVAAAILFLANPALSGFVTGTTIHVDGGNRAAGGWHRQPDGSYST